jgi:hypothetical protein
VQGEVRCRYSDRHGQQQGWQQPQHQWSVSGSMRQASQQLFFLFEELHVGTVGKTKLALPTGGEVRAQAPGAFKVPSGGASSPQSE